MQTHSLILRIVAVSLLLYSLWLFASSTQRLEKMEEALAEERHQLLTLQEENNALKKRLGEAHSSEKMEELARERLGLVKPGEIIFCFISDRAAP